MNLSATRLTLYSIISALEIDLRRHLTNLLIPTADPNDSFGNELFERLFQRYQIENGGSSYFTSVCELVEYLDFKDVYAAINRNSDNEPKSEKIPILKFEDEFSKLTTIRNRVAHSRPLQIDDLPFTLDFVQKLISESGVIFTTVEETLKEIELNPGCVLSTKIPEPPRDNTSHNLPVPDFDETGFVGRSAQAKDGSSLFCVETGVKAG
jgi:LuxR family glucitol operon transcriptional activator